MNRHTFQQPQQPQHAFSVPELNKGLGSLNLDSNTLKKLTVSGIREFVPQPSSTQSTSARFSSGSGNSAQMRHSSSSSNTQSFNSSNFVGSGSSDRLNPNPAMIANSPSQSPTPAAMGMMGSNSDASSASNIAIYNEGGTTYFYSGDEMVSFLKYISVFLYLHIIFFYTEICFDNVFLSSAQIF